MDKNESASVSRYAIMWQAGGWGKEDALQRLRFAIGTHARFDARDRQAIAFLLELFK